MTEQRSLRRRVYRYLDAALCRGAFEVSGSLWSLSADAIADGIAAEWDDRKTGFTWKPGTATLEAADLEPHVQRWLELNT